MIRMSEWILGFYGICRFGDDVTTRFQDVANSVYDCPWYAMSKNLSKRFPMLIAITQRPLYLYACFNIRCTRVTFQKVNFEKK